MALKAKHKETEFGVGDIIRVTQRIEEEGGKKRSSIFEGMVLSIKGQVGSMSFLVRKIGEAGIGIERIYPIDSPTIESVVLVKKGLAGVRRAKLYYTRTKSPREIEQIFSRVHLKNQPQKPARKKLTKKKKASKVKRKK